MARLWVTCAPMCTYARTLPHPWRVRPLRPCMRVRGRVLIRLHWLVYCVWNPRSSPGKAGAHDRPRGKQAADGLSLPPCEPDHGAARPPQEHGEVVVWSGGARLTDLVSGSATRSQAATDAPSMEWTL